MAISRYSFVNNVTIANKALYGTSSYNIKINKAIDAGYIDFFTHILADGERLDQLSYKYYNDANYWWVIAAASRIGWSLQVPPGTVIRIPKSLTAALGVV